MGHNEHRHEPAGRTKWAAELAAKLKAALSADDYDDLREHLLTWEADTLTRSMRAEQQKI